MSRTKRPSIDRDRPVHAFRLDDDRLFDLPFDDDPVRREKAEALSVVRIILTRRRLPATAATLKKWTEKCKVSRPTNHGLHGSHG